MTEGFDFVMVLFHMLKRTLLAFSLSTTPVSVFASDISEPLPALYGSPELTASLHQESPQNTLEINIKNWTSFVRCISSKYVDHEPCTQEHKTRVVSYLHELNATLGAVTEISQTRLIGIIDSCLEKLQKEFPPTC